MSVFAIGDLHLSFNEAKPMDIFGENWSQHEEKIEKNWRENIKEEDTVVLLGDFSWAMSLSDALKDFEFINKLPGKKILLKGNHDYWWTTVAGMKKYLKENNIENIEFLQNNSFLFEDKIICGARGWQINDEENRKLINRELIRLELSLEDAKNKKKNNESIIVCMHYPPLIATQKKDSKFVRLMKEYNVKKCLYGHLHGISQNEAIEGNIEDIEFKLISADYINFNPLKL